MKPEPSSGNPLTCPKPAVLSEFLVGRSAPETMQSVADHLTACPPCAVVFDDLDEQDSVVSKLRRYLTHPTPRSMLNANSSPPSPGKSLWSRPARPLRPKTPDTLPMTSRPEAPTPRQFGGYELLKRIGYGGMGVVWKARQVRLNRLVALKMIRFGMAAGDVEHERFRLEGEAVARIRHPEHRREFSMPANTTASPTLPWNCWKAARSPKSSRTSLQPARRRRVAAYVGAGRPGRPRRRRRPPRPQTVQRHVQRRRRRQGRRLRLGQIGGRRPAARRAPATFWERRVTWRRSKPRRRPRRRAAHRRLRPWRHPLRTSRRARRPSVASDRDATLQQVLSGEPAPLPRFEEAKPQGLAAICMKCLEKDPRDRYPSAAALAEDLDRWLHDLDTEAKLPGRLARVCAALCTDAPSWRLRWAYAASGRRGTRRLDALESGRGGGRLGATAGARRNRDAHRGIRYAGLVALAARKAEDFSETIPPTARPGTMRRTPFWNCYATHRRTIIVSGPRCVMKSTPPNPAATWESISAAIATPLSNGWFMSSSRYI